MGLKHPLQKFFSRGSDHVVRPIHRSLLNIAVRGNMLDWLADKVASEVREVRGNDPADRAAECTVLALSPHRFRRDLQVLADVARLRVLCMPYRWQRRLFYSFHAIEVDVADVHNPRPGSPEDKLRMAYRDFLRAFLPRFLELLGADVVIGANVRDVEDVDIGAVATELGTPYVVFHRENMLVPEGVFEFVTERFRRLDKFQGHSIAVHNAITAQSFAQAGYATREQVLTLGCLRMDEFSRRLQLPRKKRARPLVALFSFKSYLKGIFDAGGYFPVFRDSHGPIAHLAKRHPEIDFVIKPKSGMLRKPRFRAELDEAFRQWGVDPHRLPVNLRVDANIDAHDLILESSVVLGLNSTTQLEAAVAGLPVIMPYFKDMRSAPVSKNIKFTDHLELFDVPDTPEDLIALVLNRLGNSVIPSDITDRRRALFADLVSPLDGGATERYADLLCRVGSRGSRAQTEVTGTRA
jgi:hypothetical protein